MRARRGDRLGLFQSLFPRVDHRRAPVRLDGRHGRNAIHQSHLTQFAESLVHAQRAHPAADGLNVPVGCAPARCISAGHRAEQGGELLTDLEGDGLHGFDGGDRARAHVEIQSALAGELRRQLLGLVVGGRHLDYLASVQGDLPHLDRRDEAGDKGPKFDACPGRVGRVGDGDVACGGGHHFGDACLLERGNRDRGLAILEGAGRPLTLVFDEQVGSPQHHPEVDGLDQRRAALAEAQGRIGVANRQEFAIPP